MKKLFIFMLVILTVFGVCGCIGDLNSSSEAFKKSQFESYIDNSGNETNSQDESNAVVVEGDKITSEEVLSGAESSKKFVVGEELKNLNSGEIILPLNDVKANILDSKIIKSKILDINNPENFVYVGGDYEFYKYQYAIKISGSIDNKYSGKYIRLKFDFPSGTMLIQTFFKGYVSDLGSYWYNSNSDLSGVSGCVFKVESDGSFKGEITAFSNENINEYMITGIGFVY